MILNLSFMDVNGIRNTLGEYNPVKKTLYLFYSKQRLASNATEVNIRDFTPPGEIERIDLVDLDFDHRHTYTAVDFAGLPRNDGHILFDLKDGRKLR